MRTLLTCTFLLMIFSYGCASNQDGQSEKSNTAAASRCCIRSASQRDQEDIWHVNGYLQINVHVPDQLAGRTVSYFLNGEPACFGGTNLTFTMSLPPYWKNEIKIKVSGAKPFEQSIKVAGYGSRQVMNVTLAQK